MTEDPAKARFLFIAVHRLFGAALVVLGILAVEGILDWGATVGLVLIVLGVIDVFLVPLALARLWRTPPE